MKFGLTAKNWRILEQHLIQPIKSCEGSLWVFGSRARGDFKKFSDLDILVEFKSPAPKGLLANIRMALEESNLPIKVDLVERQNLAASYVPNVEKDCVEI